jgi:hypothetical protein
MSPPMGLTPQSASVRVEPRLAKLDTVPVRMARVLQHAPRMQHEERATG